MITKEQKKDFVKKFGKNKKNTGKIEVQIAILDAKIKDLTKHIIANKKDKHSKLGLYKRVSKRNSLLKYLKNENFDRYSILIKELGLRK